MLYMLAERFLTEIRSGSRPLVRNRSKIPFSSITCLDDHVRKLNVLTIQTLIQNKLRRTHSLVLSAAKAPDQAQFRREQQQRNLVRATRERRASRRKLVCICVVLFPILVHNLPFTIALCSPYGGGFTTGCNLQPLERDS